MLAPAEGWIELKNLSTYDRFVNSNKLVVENLNSIIINNSQTKVYNIEVEGNSNYFVGNNKILVHNKNISSLSK